MKDLHVGQVIALDGVRHQVLEQNGRGFLLLNQCNFSRTEFSFQEIKELYAGARLRFLSHGEAFDVLPGDRLPLVVEDITDLSAEEIKEIRFKHACVQALTETRGKPNHVLETQLRALSNEYGYGKPSLKSLYRWRTALRNWDGSPRALAGRHRCKGNRTARLSDDVQRIMAEVVRELYLRENPYSIKQLRDQIIVRIAVLNERRRAEGKGPLEDKVDYKTVWRYVQKLDPYAVLLKQHGYIVAERKFRKGGKRPLIDRPLQRVEIDHTLLDVFLVADDGKLIGRPHLTAMIDVYSRAILGIHLSFKPPNQFSISQCLRMAILPKAFLTPENGWEDISMDDWPMHGIPHEIAHDAGKDFLGNSFDDIAFQIGISLAGQPAMHPWLKGTIERTFRTVTDAMLSQIPGNTSSLKEQLNAKGSTYDPKKHAIYTFESFCKALVFWITKVHNQTQHSTTLQTPLERWNEGIKAHPPRVPPSLKELDIWLGRKETGTIINDGIAKHGISYYSKELRILGERLGDNRKVDFKINDDDPTRIYVFDPINKQYIVAVCANADVFAGLSSFEHRIIHRRAQKMSGKQRPDLIHFVIQRRNYEMDKDAARQSKNSSDRRGLAIAEGKRFPEAQGDVAVESAFKCKVSVCSSAQDEGGVVEPERRQLKVEKAKERPLEVSSREVSEEERLELERKFGG